MTLKNIPQVTEQLLSLETKVALVTGAASGIGRAIALRLAELSARAIRTVSELLYDGAESDGGRAAGRGGVRRHRSRDLRVLVEPPARPDAAPYVSLTVGNLLVGPAPAVALDGDQVQALILELAGAWTELQRHAPSG